MKKQFILILSLLILQVATYITAQYVYFALNDNCTITDDWTCRGQVSILGRMLIVDGLTIALPPLLVWLIVRRWKLGFPWKNIIITHGLVLVSLIAAIFIYLVVSQTIQNSGTA